MFLFFVFINYEMYKSFYLRYYYSMIYFRDFIWIRVYEFGYFCVVDWLEIYGIEPNYDERMLDF